MKSETVQVTKEQIDELAVDSANLGIVSEQHFLKTGNRAESIGVLRISVALCVETFWDENRAIPLVHDPLLN